ncbi:MAG: hypothetical protein V3V25_00815 [Paracoccaceae bacterium]
MTNDDPRENTREISDDPLKPQDREKEITTDKDTKKESYQYTDWASI